jgi:hypothetical protein
MFSSSGWGYSLDDDDRRKIEKSPEWKQYQELLLDTFDAQSAYAADSNSPQPELAGDAASKTEGIESNTKQDADMSGGQAGDPTQSARRTASRPTWTGTRQLRRSSPDTRRRGVRVQRRGSDLTRCSQFAKTWITLRPSMNPGLYEIPESWKKSRKTQALRGATADGWSDALQLAAKKLVTDQVNTSLKMVLKHDPAS